MVEERATFALKSEATWDDSSGRAIVPSNERGSLLQGACMDVDVTTTEGHTLRFKYFGRGCSKDVWRCDDLVLEFSSIQYCERVKYT